MARGFSALRDVYPRTPQQIFIYALRIGQLALTILIRQRALRFRIGILHRTATGFIVILVLHLLCNGAVPKYWKRYEGDGEELIPVPSCGSARARRMREFRESGGGVSKRHMTVPVAEVVLAGAFGTVFAVGIALSGAPGGYSGCQGPLGSTGECKVYGQLFEFVMALEGLLGVTITYWSGFLCWQSLSVRAFFSVTFYHFPLLYLQKRRTVREYTIKQQSEKDTVKTVLDSVTVETAPRCEDSSSKLYTVLGVYLTLSAIAPHLHHGDLLNLLLASKRTYSSMHSAAGDNLRIIFSKTCHFTPKSIKIKCYDCGATLCRDAGWQSTEKHCQADPPTIKRKHELCGMVCTSCRYRLLLNNVPRSGGVHTSQVCNCSAGWDRYPVCSSFNAEACRKRGKQQRCTEQWQGQHIIHLNGPGPIRRTYLNQASVVPPAEGECYSCRREVKGLRWWVHAWKRRKSDDNCRGDCIDQEAHYLGTAES